MTQKQIIIRGLIINYYVEGDPPSHKATAGQSTPIIFLHGWRSEAAVWLPIIQNAKFKIKNCAWYALDLPGFGASETPKTPFTLHDYAEIVREYIINVRNPKSEIQNPIVIGHSFGARIALQYAAENPALIQKLVLIGSGGARPRWRKINMCIAKLLKPFFAPRFMQPLRRKIYALIGAEDYLATPALKQTFLGIINQNLMPLCSSIQCPTLVIWGENDEEARLEYGKKMARAIPHAKLAVIKNAGHFCFRDQPEKFLEIMQKNI